MPLFTFSPEDIVLLSPWQRFLRLPLMLRILLLVGLLAIGYVGYRALTARSRTQGPPTGHSLIGALITPAFAQGSAPSSDSTHQGIKGDLKQDVMIGIVAVLAVVMLLSLVTVLGAKEPARVTVAGDILKTVLGFFIGVATSFF